MIHRIRSMKEGKVGVSVTTLFFVFSHRHHHLVFRVCSLPHEFLVCKEFYFSLMSYRLLLLMISCLSLRFMRGRRSKYDWMRLEVKSQSVVLLLKIIIKERHRRRNSFDGRWSSKIMSRESSCLSDSLERKTLSRFPFPWGYFSCMRRCFIIKTMQWNHFLDHHESRVHLEFNRVWTPGFPFVCKKLEKTIFCIEKILP